MMKKTDRHIGYYFSLVSLLILGFLLFLFASPNRQLQMLVFIITTIFYIGWGLLHHKINHDLTVRIMIEYVLIGSLGITIMLFLLKGGMGL